MMLQAATRTLRLSCSLAPAFSLRSRTAGVLKPRSRRLLTQISGRFVAASYCRSLYTSRCVFSEVKEAEKAKEAGEQKAEEDVDYSMLHPKAGGAQGGESKKQGRVFTEEQKERSRKAMKVLMEKVLNTPETHLKINQQIVDLTKDGNHEEVVDIWLRSEKWSSSLNVTAFNCIMLALVKLEENKGIPVDVERVVAHIHLAERSPNPLSFFILIDYFCKTHDFYKSRMYFASLLDAASAFFEEAQDAYDVLEEQGAPIPPNLQPPDYDVYKFCGFESMATFKNAISYYVLLVSKADGKSGPLSRKRTIEAMSKQWASTEFGAASPLDDTEALLHAEEKITHDYFKDHHHIHLPHLSKDT